MLPLTIRIRIRVHDTFLFITSWIGLLLCLSLLGGAMLNHTHFTIQWTPFSVSLTKLSHLILPILNLLVVISWLRCLIVESRGIIRLFSLAIFTNDRHGVFKTTIILPSHQVIVRIVLVSSERGPTAQRFVALFMAIQSCLPQVWPRACLQSRVKDLVLRAKLLECR